MNIVKLFLFLTIFTFYSSPCYAQAEKPQDPPKKDSRVDSTHWGNVVGHIYDAQTGFPIQNATISIETEEGFLEKGRSISVTKELGEYKAQAILGRISHNFDLGRGLLSSGIGLLFGSATNTTKRVDAARFTVHVIADGYRTYVGTVRAKEVDAKAFTVYVHPILLVPASEPGESFTAEGWTAVKLNSVEVSPRIAKQSEKVIITAKLTVFGKQPSKTIEVVAISPLWKGEKKLKCDTDTITGNSATFYGDHTIFRKEKIRSSLVTCYIKSSKLDYDPVHWFAGSIIQWASDETGAKIGERNLELLSGKSDPQQIASYVSSVLDDPQSTVAELYLTAVRAAQSNDWSSSAEAWRRLSIENPSYLPDEVGESASAFLKARKIPEIIKLVEPQYQKIKSDSKWDRKLSAQALGIYGRAVISQGDLKTATDINKTLLLVPYSGLENQVMRFRAELRLFEVENTYRRSPKEVEAINALGRALIDQGRYEEGIEKLLESIDINGAQPTVSADISWAALKLTKQKEIPVNYDEVITQLKNDLGIGTKNISKDFVSWAQYATLLYQGDRSNSGQGVNVVSEETIEAFKQCMIVGRVGAERSSGAFDYTYGYTSGSEVAISGFAYPEANAVYVLVNSLRTIQRDPSNVHAWVNEASALADLGLLHWAREDVAKALAIDSENTEGLFLSALISQRLEQEEDAKALLGKVLKNNPRHPRANLVLAEILTSEGDDIGAAECLANHGAFYGYRR